jgi:hypothetical protein
MLLCLSTLATAQTTEQDRRLSVLEQKMRELDPSFQVPAQAGWDDRLAALEARMAQLVQTRLAAESGPPSADAALDPIPTAPLSVNEAGNHQQLSEQTGNPLQRVSVTGDYQASGEGETRLPVSGYMDFHVNKFRGEPARPDFHRFVLLFGHSFSTRIKFWSEFELEHSFVEGREVGGEIALEQAYLDFLIKPWLNVRAGMLLTPVGIINERHEPPSFNGVERPFVETVIIPSTWRELGFGFTGDLGRGFRYRAYMISALDASRFNAESGIQEGRTNGFDASFRNPAFVGRVEYAGVRRLTLGASFYTGKSGFNLVSVNPRVAIGSFDGRFSFRRFDFRGLFANTWISHARELNEVLERQVGFLQNVGRELRGYYAEPAVHVLPRRLRNDLILFTRYEKYNTQHRMPEGFVPLPQFNQSSWVAGVTYKPNADIAVKFDYSFNRNASTVVRAIDSINLGLGWWF